MVRLRRRVPMSPAPNASDVLDLDGVCRLLDCGPKVVRRLVKIGGLPFRKIDRRGTLRFERRAVLDWLGKRGAR
jgi:hypothetical protein